MAKKLIEDMQEEVVKEEVKEEVVEKEEPKEEAIQSIDFSIFNKRKFSINGDADKIIELDPSDLNIITRIQEEYPKLQSLVQKVEKIEVKEGDDEEEVINKVANQLKEIDGQMRECVNKIFDFDVCSVCVPSGSLYDPIKGKLRYEYLVETLANLYNTNLDREIAKLEKRISTHTKKYTKR